MAVLFDFDGTLFDTSHDIHAAVNQLLAEQNKEPLGYQHVRSLINKGAKGILEVTLDNPEKYKSRVIEICMQLGFPKTKPFPGIADLLDELDQQNIPWGIVTNRISVLTAPILESAGYHQRAHCLVYGDTTDKIKPHPKPLLHAADLLNKAPSKCVYVGDAITDIQAGKAANMKTIAAAFGFINPAEPVHTWQADHVANTAADILPKIKSWIEV